jgi:hypothetical protein
MLLLPCGQWPGMVPRIWALTFLWPWICECLSWVRPWDKQNRRSQRKGLFFICSHNSFVESGQVLNSHEPFGLASLHLSVHQVQTPNFLRPTSRIVEFGTVVHIGLHTVPSLCWLGSCCYTRILHRADSCPNFFHTTRCKLSSYLLRSGWSFLFDRRSVDDSLSWNLA